MLRLTEFLLYLSLFGSAALHGALRRPVFENVEERLFLLGVFISSILLLFALYYKFAPRYQDDFFFYRIGGLFRKAETSVASYKKFWIVFRVILLLALVSIVVVMATSFVYYVLLSPVNQNNESEPTLEVNGYSLVLPSGWDATRLSGNSYNLTLNSIDVGFIRCPMPETGFEAWNFEKQSRLFEVDGIIYGADLWSGVAISTDNEDINLIFMHRGAFEEWYNDRNYQYSCYIQLADAVSEKQLEELYHSITFQP